MTSTDMTASLPLKPACEQTVLVTGPTRGLGREAALHLASLGARLILLGRPSMAFDAVATEARALGANVEQVGADFASLASVRAAIETVVHLTGGDDRVGVDGGVGGGVAGSVLDRSETSSSAAKHGGIDAIVANAGLQMADRVQSTVDGFEITFAVNVLANHLLLTGLSERLNDGAHVVIVGSGTHYGKFPATLLVAAPRWSNAATLARAGSEAEANSRSGQSAYATSKLAVNYLVNEFQRRDTRGIRYNVFDPGLMPGTGLARDMPAYKQWVWDNLMPKMTFVPGTSTPVNSGRFLARLAVGLDHPELRGGYVEIDHVSRASQESFNVDREADLLAVCDELAKS